MSIKGLVFNIQRYCIHDGPGIRTIVFLKGCPLRCLWCQNPEGMLPRPEIFLYKEKCFGCGRCVITCPAKAIEIYEGKSRTNRDLCKRCGKCVEVCPTEARVLMGKWFTPEEVFNVVVRDRVFYETSGGGVTLSGGEPLAQPEFTIAVLKLCRDAGIHTAIETSGYASWEVLRRVLEYTDLILYDFKHMDPRKHKEYTGVSNELILENARRISRESSVPIWARVPIIPGYNDSFENFEATARFIANELGKAVKQVNLLPYHRLGESKYERLERSYSLAIEPPTEEHMLRLKKIFESYGLETYIGG